MRRVDDDGPSFELGGIVRRVKLTRFGGQVDYAAIANSCVLNSNSIGLT